MSPHEYCLIFPEMDAAGFAALKEDIRQQGQREAVVIFEGKILDGRHRWKACEELGRTAKTREFDGDDALAFVVSHNLTRRHLSESQRAMAAGKLANLRRGGFEGNKNAVAEKTNAGIPALEKPVVTQTKAAEMLNVSRDSVQQARLIQGHGSPELGEAVGRGEISLAAAVDLTKLPKERQAEILAEGPAAVKDKVREIREYGAELNHSLAAPPPADAPKRNVYVAKIGMEIVAKVTAQLDRITDPDKEFEPALRAVIEYCERRLAQRSKR